MPRLIDADNIEIDEECTFSGKGIRAFLNAIPTTYDVDKVVEQFEKNKEDAIKAIDENGKSEYHFIKIKDLKELFEEYTREQIEIVKSGGID